MPGKSARQKIREFLEANVGKIITTRQIREIAGISEYARRIRELRNDEGMQIRTHIDRTDLKPGEYILESLERVPVLSENISPALRNQILERNGYTCQFCGAGPGDRDPFTSSRKVRLHIDHIVPRSQDGTVDPKNLRVLCSACNQGRSNIQPPTESALNLIARIRKAPRSVRREIYDILSRSFKDST